MKRLLLNIYKIILLALAVICWLFGVGYFFWQSIRHPEIYMAFVVMIVCFFVGSLILWAIPD